MTFEEYIKNPMGDKNSVITQREMFRTLYSEKLDKVLVREANHIDYKIYNNKDTIYIHMKVPSEVVDKFYYDVVMKFIQNKKIINTGYDNLDNCQVRFYSNDPAFVFTFAHAFIKNDLFINELKPKMSKQAVKETAKEKNPKNQIAYVKSLYFAYLIMKSKGLFNFHRARAESIPYNETYLLSQIESADIKIEKRQEAGKELSRKRNEEVKKIKDNNKKNLNQSSSSSEVINNNFSVKKTKVVSSIKPTVNTKFVTKNNLIKTTKKIKKK